MLKLKCEFNGETVHIMEGCNCLILTPFGAYKSYGNLVNNPIYDVLVKEGKLSDLRPFIEYFENWDVNGERKDWSKEWWDMVKKQFEENETMRNQVAGEIPIRSKHATSLRVTQLTINNKELIVITLISNKAPVEVMLDGETLRPLTF